MSQASPSAFARLLALREAEFSAVKALTEGDGYSDFFVEGSGPPWHEAFGDVVHEEEVERHVPSSRMAAVDAMRLRADDGYSDFFVEGSGPPWHEAFGDVVTLGDPFDARARVRALGSLRVLEAYARAKSTD